MASAGATLRPAAAPANSAKIVSVPPPSTPPKCALPPASSGMSDPAADASLLYMIAAAAATAGPTGEPSSFSFSSSLSPLVSAASSTASSRSSSRSQSPCPPPPSSSTTTTCDTIVAAAAVAATLPPEPVHRDTIRRTTPNTMASAAPVPMATTTTAAAAVTDNHLLRSRSSPTLSVASSASSLLSSRASSLFFKSSSASTISSASTSSSSPPSSASSVLNFWATSTKSTTTSSSATSSAVGGANTRRKAVNKRLQSFWAEEFRVLESDFQKFTSRQAVHKANVLRVGLLPFLRNHTGEQTSRTVSATELDRRVHILHKWWVALIAGLRDRPPHAVPAQDRAAHYEAIFGILARSEWRLVRNLSAIAIYQETLLDTLKLALTKLLMKPVAVNVAVFVGAVLAHAFFYVPGVAAPVLYLLRARQSDISRVRKQCQLSARQLRSLLQPASTVLPPHLSQLVGHATDIFTHQPQPDAPAAIKDDIYGPWVHRWWGTQDSDVFASFVKHYYTIMSDFVGPVATVCECTPDEALLAAPGLFHIHAVILRLFDSIVHRDRPSSAATSTTTSATVQAQTINEVNLSSVTLGTPSSISTRQLSRMRIVTAMKEILESSRAPCASYASTYARFFESSIMHAAAKRTAVYDADACVALCDLSEAILLVLAGNSRKEELCWSFWLDVCKRMLTSENSMTEVRTIAFLYTFWDQFACAEEYDLVEWVFCDQIWNKFFCHWSPLVRAYYMRLLCWRVIRPSSPRSDEALELLHDRLSHFYAGVQNAVKNGTAVSLVPCSPVPGRRWGIVRCTGQDTPAHRFFLASMFSRAYNGPTTTTTTMNRFDVHDEDVFIASTASSAASSPTSACSPGSPNNDYFGGNVKSLTNVLRRLKSFKHSFVATTSAESEPPVLSQEPSSPSTADMNSRRLSVSTTTTTSSSSLSSISSTYTMPIGLDAAAPMPDQHLRRSEKSYCFTLQPIDPKQRHHTTPRSRAGTIVPVPRTPFTTRHSILTGSCDNLVSPPPPSNAITYAGRALAEWNSTVRQFERFVEMRRTRDHVCEADVGTPSVLGDSF
ncbi:hypothetical protein V1509DRAFT_632817 [Lipomyces kononenkoae]